MTDKRDWWHAADAAITTLERMGFTFGGGVMWRPPLGKKPDFDLIDTLRAERDALREENKKAAKLVKLCKGFVDKHRISCAEATAEDRVYENAPELVERIAKIVGFYEYPEDEE